jgi:hypothetical protein
MEPLIDDLCSLNNLYLQGGPVDYSMLENKEEKEKELLEEEEEEEKK